MEQTKRTRWTPELCEWLRSGVKSGLTDREIAKCMGLTYESVRHQRAMLGIKLREPRGTLHLESWPQDRIEQLKQLWIVEGLSASMVGEKMGLTRNAVIGKVRRLGIGRPEKVRRKAKTKGGRVRIYEPRPKKPIRVVVDNYPDEQTPIEQRCSIFDLTDNTCRWPIGDPQKADFFFCGAATAGFTYCPKHHHRAHNDSFGVTKPTTEAAEAA